MAGKTRLIILAVVGLSLVGTCVLDRPRAGVDDAVVVDRLPRISPDYVGVAGKNEVTSHHFVERVGTEGICTREIDDVEPVTVGLEVALFLFDGYAGPITDVLARAGQVVEYRSLARIWVPGKSYLYTISQKLFPLVSLS